MSFGPPWSPIVLTPACTLHHRSVRQRIYILRFGGNHYARPGFVGLCPPSHPDRSDSFHTLSRCLFEQFRKGGEEKIYGDDHPGTRGVGASPPGQPGHPWTLHSHSTSLAGLIKMAGWKTWKRPSRLDPVQSAFVLWVLLSRTTRSTISKFTFKQ